MPELLSCSCCGRHIKAKSSRRIRLKLNNFDFIKNVLFEKHYDLCPQCEKDLRNRLEKINKDFCKF